MPKPKSIDPAAVDEAANNLARVWNWLSRFHADRLGFTYVIRASAPDDYESLRLAWQLSHTTGCPLPVSGLNSDLTIYRDPNTNAAFRFVHDVMHMTLDRGFGPEGELEVADRHLQALRGLGYGPDSLEHAIVHADLLGQLEAVIHNGAFPVDQRAFVIDCLRYGEDVAVARAAGTVLKASP